MRAFLGTVLSVIAVGVLLIAYGLLAPRAAAAPFGGPATDAYTAANLYPWYQPLQPYIKNMQILICPSFDLKKHAAGMDQADCDGDGRLVATPFQVQDSSMLVPLAKADCLIVRAPFAPAARAGSSCILVRLDR